jgi:hypothetical protein
VLQVEQYFLAFGKFSLSALRLASMFDALGWVRKKKFAEGAKNHPQIGLISSDLGRYLR